MNEYINNGDGTITLMIKSKTHGIKRCIIDTDDFCKIKGSQWRVLCIHGLFYLASGRPKIALIHSVIFPHEKDGIIDHINGDTLDNRKANLRLCTIAQNCRNSKKYKNNTSGFKGVYKKGIKWISSICVNRKIIYLGIFDSPEVAYKAYCKASLKYHGKFGRVA